MADFAVNNENSHRNNANRVPAQPNLAQSPLYFLRAGASEGNWLVYTPTNTIKLVVHDDMVKNFLVLVTGSKASDGG